MRNLNVANRGGVEDTGSRLRPRTQKNPRPRTAFPRTDTLEAKDRNARGQGPRTQAQVLSKKKRSSKIFSSDLHKKRFPKNFSSAPQNFNNSKNSAVLEPRTGQFSRTWGLEAKAKDLTFEAKDFKMCPRGLHQWWLSSWRRFSLRCQFSNSGPEKPTSQPNFCQQSCWNRRFGSNTMNWLDRLDNLRLYKQNQVDHKDQLLWTKRPFWC